MSRILMVGGLGQLGQSFMPALHHIYGADNIIVADVAEHNQIKAVANYEQLDAIHLEDYRVLVKKFKPSMIIHLPALLSGVLISYL